MKAKLLIVAVLIGGGILTATQFSTLTNNGNGAWYNLQEVENSCLPADDSNITSCLVTNPADINTTLISENDWDHYEDDGDVQYAYGKWIITRNSTTVDQSDWIKLDLEGFTTLKNVTNKEYSTNTDFQEATTIDNWEISNNQLQHQTSKVNYNTSEEWNNNSDIGSWAVEGDSLVKNSYGMTPYTKTINQDLSGTNRIKVIANSSVRISPLKSDGGYAFDNPSTFDFNGTETTSQLYKNFSKVASIEVRWDGTPTTLESIQFIDDKSVKNAEWSVDNKDSTLRTADYIKVKTGDIQPSDEDAYFNLKGTIGGMLMNRVYEPLEPNTVNTYNVSEVSTWDSQMDLKLELTGGYGTNKTIIENVEILEEKQVSTGSENLNATINHEFDREWSQAGDYSYTLKIVEASSDYYTENSTWSDYTVTEKAEYSYPFEIVKAGDTPSPTTALQNWFDSVIDDIINSVSQIFDNNPAEIPDTRYN